MATAGDVVVVSGKGSEDAMAIAEGKKIPWDERKVIEEEFWQGPGQGERGEWSVRKGT